MEQKKTKRFFDIYRAFVEDGFIYRDKTIREYHISERTLERTIGEVKDVLGIQPLYNKETKRYEISSKDVDLLRNRFKIASRGISEGGAFLTYFLNEVKKFVSLFEDDEGYEYEDYEDTAIIARPIVSKIPINAKTMAAIRKAIDENAEISFMYYRDTPRERYPVHAAPYFFYYYQERWYLIVEDCDAKKIKKYRVDRIANAAIAGRMLVKKKTATDDERKRKEMREAKRAELRGILKRTPGIFFDADAKQTKTTVRFSKAVAENFFECDYGCAQKAAPERNADGSLNVTFSFTSFLELWHFLLRWTGEFEIVSPKAFRKEYAERMTHIAKRAAE